MISSTELLLDMAPNSGELIYVGGCRQYKPNCQMGQFFIRDKNIGPKLVMEVIGAKTINEQLFAYPLQDWIVVLFSDKDKVVSQILFKKESLDNFLELHREALAEKQSLATVRIQASMAKRSGTIKDEKGDAKVTNYYAVEFEILGPGEYTDAIKQFRQQYLHPELYAVRSQELPAPVAETINTATGEITRAVV